MSLIGTLKRLLDPARQKLEEAAQKAEREMPKREVPGGGLGFQCRLCKKKSENGAYCADCLSETMEPVLAESGGPRR